MKKLDQLFIRACKSKMPARRILSVYRRFYAIKDPKPYVFIANILARICEKYNLITVVDLVSALDDQNQWMRPEAVNCSKRCMEVLITKIRFTSVKELPGLTAPAWFRNKEKTT